jgi:hypothetical protein
VPETGTPGLTRRGLETGLRSLLNGHKGGNPGYSQGVVLRATAPVLDPTGERDGENHRGQSLNSVPVPTLREYDFSDDKLQDSVGIKPPKLAA